MWFEQLLWGFWNGFTAWLVFIVHVFGGWQEFPVYDLLRSGNWYDLGFILGAGTPWFGRHGAQQGNRWRRARRDAGNEAWAAH